MMVYGSVCSGIEAATAAWHPLGWRAAFFSEIEPFPRSVLAHHYPDVPLHGDFTTIQAGDYAAIDVLVGGTPCQSFSVAGLRGGMADERGNLALEYLRLADRLRPRWLVWENVPGVLSSNGGRDFGSILGGMVELGYGFAYRVLDAQYVRTQRFPHAVPQRRRRVFVVGHLGSWQRAAAVLFERHSLRGDSAPRRQAGEGSAPGAARSTPVGFDFQNVTDTGDVCGTLMGEAQRKGGQAGQGVAYAPGLARCVTTGEAKRQDYETCTMVAHSLSAEGFDASEDGTGRGTPLVPISFGAQMSVPQVDFNVNQTPQAKNPMAVATAMAVRRLTPRECERLQGFSDDFTLVPHRGKPAADGPRYKAIGNSMAVNVMHWLGERIQAVENITEPT